MKTSVTGSLAGSSGIVSSASGSSVTATSVTSGVSEDAVSSAGASGSEDGGVSAAGSLTEAESAGTGSEVRLIWLAASSASMMSSRTGNEKNKAR